MDHVSGSRRQTDLRSGGKMIRQNRFTPRPTPYDRPQLPKSTPENPNWLTSATRLIASGAGKLLSTVFSPEVSSSSSSEELESEFSSSDDDGGVSDSAQENISGQRGERSPKNVTPIEGKSEAKLLIEQLLMQETFSREECDRLTMILKSRVSHIPIIEKGQDGKSSEIPYTAIDNGLCSPPALEAKKWLEEKKLQAGPKSELYSEDELGSPADVAKSYMRLRPPWASPLANNADALTPSPVLIDLTHETPPVASSYLSSTKLRRDSLIAGSWSISEEIRRVRAKASEDLLGSFPSSKINWFEFASGHKNRPKYVTEGTKKLGRNLNHGALLSSPSVVKTTQECLQNEAVSSTPAIRTSVQSQDVDATGSGSIEGKQDTGSIKEIAADGFCSSGPSLYKELHMEPDQRSSEGQHSNPVDLNPGKTTTIIHGEETCELLSEACMDVPIVTQTGNICSGSQNSSSMQYEEQTQKIPKKGTKTLTNKQGATKPSRNSRKNRAAQK